MKRVGIVGHEASKFTALGEQRARALIRELLADADVMVSGECPLGGIDVWAREEAEALGIATDLKIPKVNAWNPPGGYGFKARNLDIAHDSDVVHNILADSYPPEYRGRRFTYCYHCQTSDHIKSGGCWTAKRAKRAEWHIVANYREAA